MKDGSLLDVAGDVEAWVATVLGCGDGRTMFLWRASSGSGDELRLA